MARVEATLLNSSGWPGHSPAAMARSARRRASAGLIISNVMPGSAAAMASVRASTSPASPTQTFLMPPPNE